MEKTEFVFGRFLKERRLAINLTQKQLADKLGYRNTNRGIRRIQKIEDGFIDSDLVCKIMQNLDVSNEERAKCCLREEACILEQIAKLPKFKPVLVWRAMACVYVEVKMPESLTTVDEMLEFASAYAKERKALCWLKLDYNLRYHINRDGEIAGPDRSISDLPGTACSAENACNFRLIML